MVTCNFIQVKPGQTGIPADVVEALKTRSCVTRRGVTYVKTEIFRKLGREQKPRQDRQPEDVPIKGAGWIW